VTCYQLISDMMANSAATSMMTRSEVQLYISYRESSFNTFYIVIWHKSKRDK
jgi:hypothetical protein